MRAPEETARLANGVTVETPSYGSWGIRCDYEEGDTLRASLTQNVSSGEQEWSLSDDDSDAVPDEVVLTIAADLAEAQAALEVETQWRCHASDAYHEAARRLANTESDLSEARAEVAALRWHVALMREWQAAKRARDDSWSAYLACEAGTDQEEAAIEAHETNRVRFCEVQDRMLAAVLPSEEVAAPELREPTDRGASWEADVSHRARETMDIFGHFGPTVTPKDRQVKGWLHDDEEGGVCKAYFTAKDLREAGEDFLEVAAWLDREVTDALLPSEEVGRG